MPKNYTGTPEGQGRRIAVVVSRFNEEVTEALLEGALDRLTERGVASDSIDVFRVPGAWEIGQAARTVLARGHYDALIALGAVIRGDTPHFEYVCRGVTDALGRLAAEAEEPVVFGVLTTDDLEQALLRAGGGKENKGADAADVALEMVALFEQVGSL